MVDNFSCMCASAKSHLFGEAYGSASASAPAAPKIDSPEKHHGPDCAHKLAKDRSKTLLTKKSVQHGSKRPWQLRSSESNCFSSRSFVEHFP